GDEAQVGEDVLDLFALVELLAADDDIGSACADELFFEGTGLGVGAVHHGAVAESALAAGGEAADLVDDVGSLLLLIVGLMDGDLLPTGLIGPELLVLAQLVLADDAVRRIEDDLGGAVVLLQEDNLGIGEVLLELQQDFGVGAAPTVNRVVGDDAV